MLSSQGYAGFWRRFMAYLIDGLILSAVIGAADFAFGLGTGVTPGVVDANSATFGSVSFILSWLYFSLQESSARQATIGKLVMSIVVTDLNGRRISFAQATGRYFAKILSGLILGIGYLMAAFTARKQALHDMIAGTLVVRK